MSNGTSRSLDGNVVHYASSCGQPEQSIHLWVFWDSPGRPMICVGVTGDFWGTRNLENYAIDYATKNVTPLIFVWKHPGLCYIVRSASYNIESASWNILTASWTVSIEKSWVVSRANFLVPWRTILCDLLIKSKYNMLYRAVSQSSAYTNSVRLLRLRYSDRLQNVVCDFWGDRGFWGTTFSDLLSKTC